MGDPAEENDPPPESREFFPKPPKQVNTKCDKNVTICNQPDWPRQSGKRNLRAFLISEMVSLVLGKNLCLQE